MRYYYFLTIDDQKVDAHPTKLDLYLVAKGIKEKCGLSDIFPWKIEAFENKTTVKYGDRLHLHMLLSSESYYIKYQDAKVLYWSIKLEKLKSSEHVARTAGYICKHKIDKVDLTMKPTFKKDRNKPTKSKALDINIFLK